MRTAEPKNIKKDFLNALSDFERTFTDLTNVKMPIKSKSLLSEFVFLGASILLEGFLGDLFVAYINKKNLTFVTYVKSRLKIKAKDIQDKVSSNALTEFEINVIQHLTLDKIRKILDPREFNFAFIDSSDIKKKSNEWLDTPYKGYFQIYLYKALHS